MSRILRNRSLRSSTLMIFALFFLMMVVLIHILLNTVMMSSIDQLEEKNVGKNIERAVNAIEQQELILAATTKDWAAWDDTYEFVQDRNQEYLKSNIYEDVFVNLNLNLIAITDLSGEYIFATGMDIENSEFIPVYPELKKALHKGGILYNADPDFVVSGIIKLPEGMIQITSHPVLQNDLSGPVLGSMIFGKFLDEKSIKNMSQIMNLELSIEESGMKNESIADKTISTASDMPAEIRFLGEEKLEAWTSLTDINGNPVAELSIEMPREVRDIGRTGIDSMMYSLIAAGFMFVMTLWIFLEKNILSRILCLSREVIRAGEGDFSSIRISPQRKNDEISSLSEEIGRMLERRKSAEEALKKAKEELEIKVSERTAELSEANRLLQDEIDEKTRIQEKIMQLAYRDHLTGLPNKLLFTDRLKQAIFLANRTEKYLGVIFVDLDEFKMVNDTMGHDQGDELLKDVTERISCSMRGEDTVCRAGGDEFIILVQNIAETEDLARVARKIIGCFSETYKLRGQDFHITASIGVAMYPSDGEDVETLIKNADIAMYKAKEGGKNRYVMCTALMKEKVTEAMMLTNGLYRAYERNEFYLLYQPQVCSQTGEIKGVEALIRWNHPELGIIPPSRFIPLAEQTGIIISIGEWILRTACMQNMKWRSAGLPGIRMAVNLSLQQLQNHGIDSVVEDVLSETGMDTEWLELEVTESIAMKESHEVTDTLNAFKKQGIAIAIDDFGTEYSSLSRLKNLQVDRIKIAMPFVQGIGVSEKDEAIARAIIVLAKNLGLQTIAEGVETEQQLSFLRQNMCDEIQGFYYYRPMPPEEIEKLLRTFADDKG